MRLRHQLSVATSVLAVFLVSGISAGDDKPGKTERVTYRVMGLFSQDREKDLKEAFKELPDLTLVSVNYDDAEITVEFVPASAFPGAKPDQLIERFDQKLRSVTRSTFGVKPRRTVPRDKLEQVVIPVAGLDCKACCLAAYESIAGIDGVMQATASFKEGRVTALIESTKTDRTRLEEALRKRNVQVGKP
jgi:copper chaperone CopZ